MCTRYNDVGNGGCGGAPCAFLSVQSTPGALSMLVLLGAGRSVSGREFPYSHFFCIVGQSWTSKVNFMGTESMKGNSVPFIPVCAESCPWQTDVKAKTTQAESVQDSRSCIAERGEGTWRRGSILLYAACICMWKYRDILVSNYIHVSVG